RGDAGEGTQGEGSAVAGEGQAEALQPSATILEWRAEQGVDGHLAAMPEAEHVEGNVDHRHLGLDGGRRRLATEPGLQGDERQDGAVAPAEDLAVEDPVPGETAGPVVDLRELPADVVQ